MRDSRYPSSITRRFTDALKRQLGSRQLLEAFFCNISTDAVSDMTFLHYIELTTTKIKTTLSFYRLRLSLLLGNFIRLTKHPDIRNAKTSQLHELTGEKHDDWMLIEGFS